jgi:formamidopyrimidine-DNA glycosylase
VSEIVPGRRVVRTWRRGKYVVLDLSDRPHSPCDALSILIHLRMSGRLVVLDQTESPPSHVHFRLDFLDGSRLVFPDARKFGRVVVTSRPQRELAALGVEPLQRGFTAVRLGRLLAGRSRMLKPLLLDQSVIAGIGNIYADEALHRSGLHPQRRSDDLTAAEACRLCTAIRGALREGISRNGTSFDWVYPDGDMQEHLRVYGRAGQPCRACGTPIRRMVVSQRGTHFCPLCQPERPGRGKPKRTARSGTETRRQSTGLATARNQL